MTLLARYVATAVLTSKEPSCRVTAVTASCLWEIQVMLVAHGNSIPPGFLTAAGLKREITAGGMVEGKAWTNLPELVVLVESIG